MKLAFALFFLAAPALAQPSPLPTCATAAAATFDVASVKPSQIAADSSRNAGSADSITSSGTALHLIEYAYALRDFQLVGGPGWLGNATWDVVAKVDKPVPNWTGLRSDDRRAIQRQRMATVLAQRFALKCHFEIKQLPVYNLVIAKGGSKLKPTPSDATKKGSMGWDGEGRQNKMDGTGIELTALANMFSEALGRTVIDKTGLTGLYDFTLTYTSDPDPASSASADSSSGATVFTAVDEQLGLRLDPAKGPVPVLVIDSIQKPSEN